MEKHFQNKMIVIFGGASGIGRALAIHLRSYRAEVIVVDRDVVAGEKLASSHGVHFYEADVTDRTMSQAILKKVITSFAVIDFYFHAVGIVMAGELRDTSTDKWEKMVQTNIMGTVYATQVIYEQMIKQGYGHIVQFSSVAGLMPVPVMGVYSATKYAVLGMTHAMRSEANGLGIRVSAVTPGLVDTPIYLTAMYNRTKKDETLAWLHKLFKFQTPERAAERVLKGVVKNKPTIHTWHSTHLTVLFYRLSPRLHCYLAARWMKWFRKELRV